MAKSFSRIDGWPVAVGIIQDYLNMAAAFEKQFGVRLVVSSGIRTYSEQESIFRQRYCLWGDVNGRTIYDKRFWNGSWWYRISPAGTVAQPGTSNHETGRSLDLRDTGSDPGVSASFYTARNKWLSANCWRWGFTHTGKNFGEPWHFEQLQVADPFLGRGKPNYISPDDPGEPIAGGGGGSEDIMTPEQEKKLDQVLKYAKRASNKSSAAAQTAKWLKARIKGSVKQKSITTTVSEGRDTANWIQKRLKGSVEHGPSVTAMLEALLEEATGGDAKKIKSVQARAVEIDKTLPEMPELNIPEVDEEIEDED